METPGRGLWLAQSLLQTVWLDGSQLSVVGAYARGEQPQTTPMEVLLPRLDSLGKHAQLDFSFGSKQKPALQAHNSLDSLLGQGALAFSLSALR